MQLKIGHSKDECIYKIGEFIIAKIIDHTSYGISYDPLKQTEDRTIVIYYNNDKHIKCTSIEDAELKIAQMIGTSYSIYILDKHFKQETDVIERNINYP